MIVSNTRLLLSQVLKGWGGGLLCYFGESNVWNQVRSVPIGHEESLGERGDG